MKLSDLRGLSQKELKAKLGELQEEQLRMRCNLTTGQLLNHQEIKKGRRNIARIQTIMNEQLLKSKNQ